jgi:4-hydroxy-tetrahydrodipicolinate synthase
MDEMLTHFRTLKQAHPDLPLLVYNIPQTVKVKMTVQTTLQLATEGTVQGIKDSQNDLRWFRQLAVGARAAGLGQNFRLFLGTRALIDAGALLNAHGAIPATANVVPAACAETWESAMHGDFAQAARAQEVVLDFEDLSLIARGGSSEAAGYSSMKHTLREWGIIENAAVTRPLREFSEAEVAELRERLARLPHGSQRVAVPA